MRQLMVRGAEIGLVAAVGVVALLFGVLRPDGAPGGAAPAPERGEVIGWALATDPDGDVELGWADLVAVELRRAGDALDVTWTLDEQLPRPLPRQLDLSVDLEGWDLRSYHLRAVAYRGERAQLSSNGPGPLPALKRYVPTVAENRVSVRIPLSDMPWLRAPFRWSANSSVSRGVSDRLGTGAPGVWESVFPNGARPGLPFRPAEHSRPNVEDPAQLDVEVLVDPVEIWVRNTGPATWERCWVTLNEGRSRTFEDVPAGGWSYHYTFSFFDVREDRAGPITKVDVLCQTPSGWQRRTLGPEDWSARRRDGTS